MRKPYGCCIGAMLLAALCWTAKDSSAAEEASALRVTPAAVSMGSGYNGAILTISGRVPEGSELVLRFVGAAGEMHMREKGKVLGLLWMNRTPLTFKNVPDVFLVQSSKPVDQLGPAAGPFGLANFSRNVLVETQEAAADDLKPAAELLRLKESEGLCRETVGGIRLEPAKGGMQAFSARLFVPAALKPGKYAIELFAFKEERVVQRDTATVTAELTGVPAWLHQMAFEHGTLYGILATTLAILGGLLIGVVFQGKGAGSH